MIVLDASIVVELLTNGFLADAITHELAECDESFIPHLIDVEVVSAIRRLTAGERGMDAHRSRQTLEGLAALPAERYSHTPFIGRIWELRHNFTAYDVAYLTLAEATNPSLHVCDVKLLKGHRAQVVLFKG